ncbi:helix-turn-helix domain-containing protein [uncultured Bacteroides sp.]|uniref:helix-turn-helix domain-containing protein n=1 Tax=uncultured Bacteroides sp. TaxID=162156 RepID=UPI002634038C|nr:helix-turn-helix domain-containing protein [uncultured Bacteroides sp.]
MEEQQISIVWLAKHLSCSRTNVYKLLNKYSLDTEILAKISKLLDFDFFSLYSEEIQKDKEKLQ